MKFNVNYKVIFCGLVESNFVVLIVVLFFFLRTTKFSAQSCEIMSDLPYRVEYAKTGRAGCKKCKTKIGQATLRIAAMVQVNIYSSIQLTLTDSKNYS